MNEKKNLWIRVGKLLKRAVKNHELIHLLSLKLAALWTV